MPLGNLQEVLQLEGIKTHHHKDVSGIILRIGYSVYSLWKVVCTPDVWRELVP